MQLIIKYRGYIKVVMAHKHAGSVAISRFSMVSVQLRGKLHFIIKPWFTEQIGISLKRSTSASALNYREPFILLYNYKLTTEQLFYYFKYDNQHFMQTCNCT